MQIIEGADPIARARTIWKDAMIYASAQRELAARDELIASGISGKNITAEQQAQISADRHAAEQKIVAHLERSREIARRILAAGGVDEKTIQNTIHEMSF